MNDFKHYRGRGRGQYMNNYRGQPFNNIRRGNPNSFPPLMHMPPYRERWPRQKIWRGRPLPPYLRPSPTSHYHKPPVERPPSPLPGSEEARQRVIAEASARIQQQLNLTEPLPCSNTSSATIPSLLHVSDQIHGPSFTSFTDTSQPPPQLQSLVEQHVPPPLMQVPVKRKRKPQEIPVPSSTSCTDTTQPPPPRLHHVVVPQTLMQQMAVKRKRKPQEVTFKLDIRARACMSLHMSDQIPGPSFTSFADTTQPPPPFHHVVVEQHVPPSVLQVPVKRKRKPQEVHTTVEELRNKILTQFNSMSKCKIQNLVNNPGSSKYDTYLHHLVRDMRLHLSQELRTMYHNREEEASREMIDRFNSIVPDLGVELANLPDTMVAELSKILQFDVNPEQAGGTGGGPNAQLLQCPLLEPEPMLEPEPEPILEVTNNLLDITDPFLPDINSTLALPINSSDAFPETLVEPEDMFKQAENLLLNTDFLDSAQLPIENLPSPDSTISLDPFINREPLCNEPPPSTHNLIEEDTNLLLTPSIDVIETADMEIDENIDENSLSNDVHPVVEDSCSNLDEIPLPDSNFSRDSNFSSLDRTSHDASPFSKKLLEMNISESVVESERERILPVFQAQPLSRSNSPFKNPDRQEERTEPTLAAQFDFNWVFRQKGEISNVTSFLDDVTSNTGETQVVSRGENTATTPTQEGPSSQTTDSEEDDSSPRKSRPPLDERIKMMMKMKETKDEPKKHERNAETLKHLKMRQKRENDKIKIKVHVENYKNPNKITKTKVDTTVIDLTDMVEIKQEKLDPDKPEPQQPTKPAHKPQPPTQVPVTKPAVPDVRKHVTPTKAALKDIPPLNLQLPLLLPQAEPSKKHYSDIPGIRIKRKDQKVGESGVQSPSISVEGTEHESHTQQTKAERKKQVQLQQESSQQQIVQRVAKQNKLIQQQQATQNEQHVVKQPKVHQHPLVRQQQAIQHRQSELQQQLDKQTKIQQQQQQHVQIKQETVQQLTQCQNKVVVQQQKTVEKQQQQVLHNNRVQTIPDKQQTVQKVVHQKQHQQQELPRKVQEVQQHKQIVEIKQELASFVENQNSKIMLEQQQKLNVDKQQNAVQKTACVDNQNKVEQLQQSSVGDLRESTQTTAIKNQQQTVSINTQHQQLGSHIKQNSSTINQKQRGVQINIKQQQRGVQINKHKDLKELESNDDKSSGNENSQSPTPGFVVHKPNISTKSAQKITLVRHSKTTNKHVSTVHKADVQQTINICRENVEVATKVAEIQSTETEKYFERPTIESVEKETMKESTVVMEDKTAKKGAGKSQEKEENSVLDKENTTEVQKSKLQEEKNDRGEEVKPVEKKRSLEKDITKREINTEKETEEKEKPVEKKPGKSLEKEENKRSRSLEHEKDITKREITTEKETEEKEKPEKKPAKEEKRSRSLEQDKKHERSHEAEVKKRGRSHEKQSHTKEEKKRERSYEKQSHEKEEKKHERSFEKEEKKQERSHEKDDKKRDHSHEKDNKECSRCHETEERSHEEEKSHEKADKKRDHNEQNQEKEKSCEHNHEKEKRDKDSREKSLEKDKRHRSKPDPRRHESSKSQPSSSRSSRSSRPVVRGDQATQTLAEVEDNPFQEHTALRRLMDIDLQIQALMREKFQLYQQINYANFDFAQFVPKETQDAKDIHVQTVSVAVGPDIIFGQETAVQTDEITEKVSPMSKRRKKALDEKLEEEIKTKPVQLVEEESDHEIPKRMRKRKKSIVISSSSVDSFEVESPKKKTKLTRTAEPKRITRNMKANTLAELEKSCDTIEEVNNKEVDSSFSLSKPHERESPVDNKLLTKSQKRRRKKKSTNSSLFEDFPEEQDKKILVKFRKPGKRNRTIVPIEDTPDNDLQIEEHVTAAEVSRRIEDIIKKNEKIIKSQQVVKKNEETDETAEISEELVLEIEDSKQKNEQEVKKCEDMTKKYDDLVKSHEDVNDMSNRNDEEQKTKEEIQKNPPKTEELVKSSLENKKLDSKKKLGKKGEEIEKKTEEIKKEKQKAEERKTEELRKAGEIKRAEELKRAEEIRKAEEKTEEKKKAEEIRKTAEKKAEEIKKAEEKKKSEEIKKAEEIRKAEEKKKAEEIRKTEEKKKAEEIRKAEEKKKSEEMKKAAEIKKAEEIRKAEEIKKAEEIRKAEEAKKAEEKRKAEEINQTEEIKKAEEIRKAEEKRKPEKLKKIEEPKKSEDTSKVEELKEQEQEDTKIEEIKMKSEEILDQLPQSIKDIEVKPKKRKRRKKEVSPEDKIETEQTNNNRQEEKEEETANAEYDEVAARQSESDSSKSSRSRTRNRDFSKDDTEEKTLVRRTRKSVTDDKASVSTHDESSSHSSENFLIRPPSTSSLRKKTRVSHDDRNSRSRSVSKESDLKLPTPTPTLDSPTPTPDSSSDEEELLIHRKRRKPSVVEVRPCFVKLERIHIEEGSPDIGEGSPDIGEGSPHIEDADVEYFADSVEEKGIEQIHKIIASLEQRLEDMRDVRILPEEKKKSKDKKELSDSKDVAETPELKQVDCIIPSEEPTFVAENNSVEEETKAASIAEESKASSSSEPDPADHEEETKTEPTDAGEKDETAEKEDPGVFCIGHHKSILDIKVLGDEFLAASEDGVIYKYCVRSGELQDAYTGHKRAVTCIYAIAGSAPPAAPATAPLLYSGSLDCTLRCYNLDTAEVLHAVTVSQAIQCMDSSWGYIFLGTYEGLLFIYNMKKRVLHGDSLCVASATVLMLRCTTEGGRQVLLLASRKREIVVRDAFTGLLLRTMCSDSRPTVYSLLLHRSQVFAGTSDKGIIILDFHNGSQRGVYVCGKGVVCMVLYKSLLFAGCYDGLIYVFDTRTQAHVRTLPGPGDGMLLSLAISHDMIIAGTKKDHLLKIWKIPQDILDGI